MEAVINPELLKILVCPEDKSALALAEPSVIASINAKIDRGEVSERGGKKVTSPLAGGLVRSDRRYLYPIRDGIPILLIDAAIPLT